MEFHPVRRAGPRPCSNEPETAMDIICVVVAVYLTDRQGIPPMPMLHWPTGGTLEISMARGDPSPALQARIDALLPDPWTRGDAILSLSPAMISVAFNPDSDIPVASICLLDALRTIGAARYALFESHAHGIYYRENVNPAEEMHAVWFEQFYVQDAAHRLYGAAEDIAEALIMMLEISPPSMSRSAISAALV
jgi:hypothetical protein